MFGLLRKKQHAEELFDDVMDFLGDSKTRDVRLTSVMADGVPARARLIHAPGGSLEDKVWYVIKELTTKKVKTITFIRSDGAKMTI